MTSNIENVVIFVSDALRWDYLPDEVASKGIVCKTVAQGCKTAISFPTLATGLRPQQHGVSEWGHQLPEDVFSVFRSDSINSGFRNSGRSFSGLCSVVGAERETDLADLDPPFLYMERDNNPHSPHAGFDNLDEYFDDRGADTQRMRQDYVQAAGQSQQLFERRLEELSERDLLDETLVIFTSDHGELWGEYGELDHGAPACPELVYVPTVFIHPDLSEEDLHVDPSQDIIEHVDITATAFATMDLDVSRLAGTDVLTSDRQDRFGHCYTEENHKGIQFYEADSIWWHEGGHVFTKNRRTERLLYVMAHAYKANRRRYLRKNMLRVLKHYFASSHTFENPPIGKQDAQNQLKNMLEKLPERDSVTLELDRDAKETLKDLGYLQ